MMRKAIAMLHVGIVILVILVIAAAVVTMQRSAPQQEQPVITETGPAPVEKMVEEEPQETGQLGQVETVAPNQTPQETQPAPSGGLLGEYYQDVKFTGSHVDRIDPTINFEWRNQAPIEGIDGSRFGVIWKGKLKIDAEGDYIIILTVDDTGVLFIKGAKTVDLSDKSGVNSGSTRQKLAVGEHDIEIRHTNIGGSLAKAKLEYWASELKINRTVIPSSALIPP